MDIKTLTISVLVIAVSYFLEEKNKWLGHISGVLLIILIAILLGNTGIVSPEENTYLPIFKWAVPIGIALMLMAFNPKAVLKVPKIYMLSFSIGVVASIIGGIVAGFVFRKIIPGHSWQVAGQLTASYVGGYENSVAIGTALNTPKNIFLTAFAGDSILTASWLIINIIHAKIVRSEVRNRHESRANIFGLNASFDLSSLSIVIALSIATVFGSSFLNSLVPAIPKIIWLSILATGLTFFPWRKRLEGSYVIGSLILSLFFFACGAVSNIRILFNSSALLVFFPAIIVAIHAAILFTTAHFMRIDRKAVIVTSQALIGGPATALAVVQAVRWNNRFEAIVLGLLGYAIANYIGYAVAWFLIHI